MHLEWYQQGLTKAQAQDFSGAIADFDQVLQVAPDFALAYYQRGLAHFRLDQLQEAIADYNNALRLDTQTPTIYYARGLAYLTTGALDLAVEDAKQAILLKADYAAAYDLLGTVRQRQGMSDRAIASYKRAAELYLDQRDAASCRRCLERVHQLQPAPVQTNSLTTPSSTLIDVNDFLQKALTKADQGKYREAMEDLDWAIQLDSEDAYVYAYRGQVQAQMGSRMEAIADYQQAARLFNTQGDKQMAQQMLDTIEKVRRQITQAANSPWAASPTPYPTVTAGTPSRAVQQRLQQLIGNDRKIVSGLVIRLKLKHPGMSEDWYWEKAIYDLERDRR
jgi:tetratricopeptide (TPR) repeat protein